MQQIDHFGQEIVQFLAKAIHNGNTRMENVLL